MEGTMSALSKALVTILFVIIIFWVSVFNRDAVNFSVYPLIDSASIPLALIILGSVMLGFIWGAVIVWLNGGVTRSEARRLRREVKSLEKENTKKDDVL
jgi:uncharacterized integral membrane protein